MGREALPNGLGFSLAGAISRLSTILAFAALPVLTLGLDGQEVNARGTVTMADGSPPPRAVLIQRFCGTDRVTPEALTNSKGEYILRSSGFDAADSWGVRRMGSFGIRRCFLRAQLSGYESNLIDLDDPKVGSRLILPPLVLRRKGGATRPEVEAGAQAPAPAQSPWSRGAKALAEGNLTEAERHLRVSIVAAPQFAPAWNALGVVYLEQKRYEEARAAFRGAMAADPNALGAYLLLMRLESEAKNWEAARRSAADVIARDSGQRFPESYLHQAVALFYLKDLDGAASSAAEAVRLNRNHQMTNVDYVHGLILEAKGDRPAAAESYRKYLENEPQGSYAQVAQQRLDGIERPGTVTVRPPELDAVDLNVKTARSVWTPGGMRALAAMARLNPVPPASAFFAAYCRNLARLTSVNNSEGISGLLESLRQYFAAVQELSRLGEQRGESVTISLSLATPADHALAERALHALGWTVTAADKRWRVRWGSAPADVARQPIAGALGIDPAALRSALEEGHEYTIHLETGEAPLMGGEAWLDLLHDKQMLAGGVAEAFVRDVRLAASYAGLSAAGDEAASAMLSALDLRTLVQRYSGALAVYGGALKLRNGAVDVPGGEAAEEAWKRVSGADPKAAPAFFRALLSGGHGKLLAFYSAIHKTDRAHQ